MEDKLICENEFAYYLITLYFKDINFSKCVYEQMHDRYFCDSLI